MTIFVIIIPLSQLQHHHILSIITITDYLHSNNTFENLVNNNANTNILDSNHSINCEVDINTKAKSNLH